MFLQYKTKYTFDIIIILGDIMNNKQKIILTSLIISSINILLFFSLFTFILSKNNINNNINKELTYNISFNKEIYYVGLNETINIDIDNKNILYNLTIEDETIANIKDNKLTGLSYGNTEIILIKPDNTIITSKVYVVKGMVNRPKEFDYNKEYITCNYFTDKENEILDNALVDRINDVTFQTRASVVEAARFLTLSFDYRIPYFYENGRLNNYGGKEHVDGEGRYYHKGLYLSTKKYNEISAKLYGPASWGCELINITKANSYGYFVGSKYPNGLDCSGFISWVLLNGGFDVKDTGAGETYRDDDLYDLGKKNKISLDLLNSSKVKVGDLIAYSGHMAMIIGIDNNDLYIAETLPHLKGVVAKKYTKQQAINTFTHIMLMDEVYKNNGKLTDMWY